VTETYGRQEILATTILPGA